MYDNRAPIFMYTGKITGKIKESKGNSLKPWLIGWYLVLQKKSPTLSMCGSCWASPSSEEKTSASVLTWSYLLCLDHLRLLQLWQGQAILTIVFYVHVYLSSIASASFINHLCNWIHHFVFFRCMDKIYCCGTPMNILEIGRASCRERVWHLV